MKNKFDFAADCITVNGKTFPARYEVTTAAVNVFATVTEDGKEKTVCICIEAGNELYGPAALAAAKEAPEVQQAEPEAQQAEKAQQAEPEAKQAEEVQQAEPEAEQTAPEAAQTEPEAEQAEPEAEQTAPEAAQTEPEAQQAEQEAQQAEQEAPQAARDPKAARGVVPEKTFIGQSITGAGWAIIFDGSCNRTRVIISKGQHEKLRGIVESAGFYYSASMDSWNRKLTFRAYRAAQALAQELTAALAA